MTIRKKQIQRRLTSGHFKFLCKNIWIFRVSKLQGGFIFNILNMAGRRSILLSPKCMAWLALFIILCYNKPAKDQDSRLVNVFIASALNIKHFPARNSCISRKYVKRTRIAPSAKCLTAINLGKIALLAAYLVLLSDDVMTNPRLSYYTSDVPTFLQKPGLKTAQFKHQEPT